jgi:hypothetical protein
LSFFHKRRRNVFRDESRPGGDSRAPGGDPELGREQLVEFLEARGRNVLARRLFHRGAQTGESLIISFFCICLKRSFVKLRSI